MVALNLGNHGGGVAGEREGADAVEGEVHVDAGAFLDAVVDGLGRVEGGGVSAAVVESLVPGVLEGVVGAVGIYGAELAVDVADVVEAAHLFGHAGIS